MFRTEDQVRTAAGNNLGFYDGEQFVIQGVGQLTSFKQLGFTGADKQRKPDGWYLPNDKSKIAIILEAKSEDKNLTAKAWVEEITRNIAVARQKYAHVVGILYNGKDIRVWKNETEIQKDLSPNLEHKSYYMRLFTQIFIDKQQIYGVTKRINDSLHNDFKMADLTDRMIFTACALVAQRYNPNNGESCHNSYGKERTCKIIQIIIDQAQFCRSKCFSRFFIVFLLRHIKRIIDNIGISGQQRENFRTDILIKIGCTA